MLGLCGLLSTIKDSMLKVPVWYFMPMFFARSKTHCRTDPRRSQEKNLSFTHHLVNSYRYFCIHAYPPSQPFLDSKNQNTPYPLRQN